MSGTVVRLVVLVCGALVATETQAADLPARKAAPVEYLRVCSQYGAGFFVIPGTATCMKVAGRVRAEYKYEEPFGRTSNATSFRARAYLSLDSYAETDWGPLRATSRIYVTRDSGRGGTGGANISNANATTNADITLDWAYIQFAGLTAGRLEYSFFDFSPIGEWGFLDGTVVGRGAYHQSINALAYTAQFGSGLTATLAVEDRSERSEGLNTYTPYAPGFGGYNPTTFAVGGQMLPDIVARIDWTQDWGTAVLAGAMHQSRPGGPFGPNFNGIAVGVPVIDTKTGFAVNAGLKLKLSMIAPGDALMISGVYGYGASNYTGWSNSGAAGSLSPLRADAVLVPGTPDLKLSTSYSVSAGMLHYWTPSLRQSVFAAYGGLRQQGPFDVRAVTVGSNIIWSPVRALNIGGEVYYSKLIGIPISAYDYDAASNAFIKAGTSPSNWGGRLRIQRDF